VIRGVSRTTAALSIVVSGLSAPSCVSQSVPDPLKAARAYEEATARGDEATLYAMLTAASRRILSPDDVRAMVERERAELAEQGRPFGQGDLRVEATARLRYADGEEAALDLQDGRYWVTAAGALPGGGRTPAEAVDQLRRVLARRSYDGLMRVLSPATRTTVEQDVRSLVEGLSAPDSLLMQVNGDTAVIAVPGGHQVKLRRESGVWRVDDFD